MKQLRIVTILVTLATGSMIGIAAAQRGEEVVAYFYSDKFQGKKTASGEVYDKDGLTARHTRSFPTEPKLR